MIGKDDGIRKVLLVEDEEALAEILSFNLNKHGFQVFTAADGLEACRIIGREQPDLILLDILMPPAERSRGLPYGTPT